MNNDELLDALEDEQERFLDLIDDISDEDLEKPGVIGDWSIKNILSHISAWEAELVKLLWQAKQGQKPTTVHFRHVDVDQQNKQWFQEMKDRPLERVIEDFHAVRKQTLRRVESFTNKDLTDPHRFPWLGENPLWKWIAEDTFEHEAEHREQIESWRKQQEG